MQITVNLTDPRANSIALDEVIFAQAETTLTFAVSPSTESLTDGLSVALLTLQGETLAHALVSASTAILNTSTVECYEFAKGLPVEATRGAYLVIGESTHPIAIIPVQVARNPIADIAPPTESAPIYPTSQELQSAIDRIETALATIEKVEDIVQGFDETVQQGIAELNATKENAISEINTAKTEALAEIGAVKTQAEGELTALVAQAQTAKAEAETAQAKAEAAQTLAETAQQGAEQAQGIVEGIKTELQDALTEAAGVEGRVTELEASVGALVDAVEVVDGAIVLEPNKAYYKSAPTTETAYSIAVPEGAEGIIDFKLLIEMGESQTLIFPSNITFQNSFVFTSNSKTLVRFISFDGGASWVAEVVYHSAPLETGTIIEATMPADDLTFKFGRYATWNYSVSGLAGHSEFTVDWGDGTQDTYTELTTGNNTHIYPQHTYANAGIYRIIISNDVQSFNMTGNDKITRLIKWGDDILYGCHPSYRTQGGLMDAFSNCSNLAGTIPPWGKKMLGAFGTFYNCKKLSGEIPSWNEVTTSVAYCYYGCKKLSGEIPSWNEVTTSVVYCYYGCSGLSGEIPSWNEVTTSVASCYYGCSGLSGEIPSWNEVTTSVVSCYYGCSGLSGEIPSWNEVTTSVASCYYGCKKLSGEIPSWNEVTTKFERCYQDCKLLTGVWDGATDETLMPSRAEAYAYCVFGTSATLRAYFTTAWGGTKA